VRPHKISTMKNFNLILLCSFLMPFFGCQEKKSKLAGEDLLRDEIFVAHDEGMAKIGQIHRLEKQLRDLSKDTSVNLDSVTHEKVTRVLDRMDQADKGMKEWMASFKQPASWRQQKSHDEIMAYLNSEKGKVDAVKTEIFLSIEEATKLLGELKK
jgi:hypothetical protein